ncbi:hypothetical protein [Actinokineospora bangkokensis]|uniref:DUF3558 domain-containing protein n=1 Tax=Actinokineospora bangkokensis TaxID=1193682 RepID=A0A1Q9LR63_9PSEU|nr:hypothetical protein [Actinokineospora bangkokensis]OLR94510.1 hypothetical protein BJP25_12255 [Actinokineospora bangkokensis]
MRWVVGVLLLVAGCASAAPADRKPSAPAIPVFGTSTSAAPRGPVAFPGSCADVLTSEDLDELVEHVLPPGTASVKGQPVPGIKRTARLDCYYALAQGAAPSAAGLTVTVAQYTDPDAARARVDATVDDATSATASEVAVGPDRGTLLDATTTRTLLVAHGELTVVATALPSVVTAGEAPRVLAAIVDRVLTAR